MTIDARVNAWVSSWQCLVEAMRVRAQINKQHHTLDDADRLHLNIAHSQLIAEATIAATLASTPEPWVGLGAGDYLERAHQSEMRAKEFIENSFEDLFKKKGDTDGPNS